MSDMFNNRASNDVSAAGTVGEERRVYIETYGCQMNVADSEVIMSILSRDGYVPTDGIDTADVVLVNTCAIRDNAEHRIHGRLKNIGWHKKRRPGMVVGVLGCMAERLRKQLLDDVSVVDIVVGPDEYRALPQLVDEARSGAKGLAVKLSRVETYDDIVPLRTDGVSAWISVMRGCDKFCTFCVVPFTRGRERSRSLESVVSEVEGLATAGFREVTLLGQNVNSYRSEVNDFADLLAAVASVDRAIRVRYTTSHPQDMSDRLISTMAEHSNICNYIHLPVQSGSDRILQLMNRTYTVDHYLERIERIRSLIPNCALSTDIIAGFPTETEEDHRRTLDLLERISFDGAFMFQYSPRENTKAWAMGDDVADGVKGRRLQEVIRLQKRISGDRNERLVGGRERVLIDGPSRRDVHQWRGRTDTNKVVVFSHNHAGAGDYVDVCIQSSNAATLFGSPISDDGVRAFIPLPVAGGIH